MSASSTKIISIIFIICAVFCRPGFAARTTDGFEASSRFESRYFTVLTQDGADLQGLAARVSVPASIRAIIREPVSSYDFYSLKDQLDLMFLAVSEIMDIRLKNFECKVKICRNAAALTEAAKAVYGRAVKTGGFYVADTNTLYIDAENADMAILGHELSHAVQVQYFVVPPPATVQEVLSGFVEYQLRKYTDTLPAKK